VGPSVANNAEWIFGGLNIDTLTHYYPYMERYDDNNPNYPHVKIQVQVRRNPWYFVIRVCVVSVLVTLMETVSFFVAPSDLSARFSISGTTFLSAIAFYFVIIEQIPKVSYATRCDIWNGLNFGLLALSSAENILAHFALSYGFIEEPALVSLERWLAAGFIAMVLLCASWFVYPVIQFQRYRQEALRRRTAGAQQTKVDK
jgi:hypothetical protein